MSSRVSSPGCLYSIVTNPAMTNDLHLLFLPDVRFVHEFTNIMYPHTGPMSDDLIVTRSTISTSMASILEDVYHSGCQMALVPASERMLSVNASCDILVRADLPADACRRITHAFGPANSDIINPRLCTVCMFRDRSTNTEFWLVFRKNAQFFRPFASWYADGDAWMKDLLTVNSVIKMHEVDEQLCDALITYGHGKCASCAGPLPARSARGACGLVTAALRANRAAGKTTRRYALASRPCEPL